MQPSRCQGATAKVNAEEYCRFQGGKKYDNFKAVLQSSTPKQYCRFQRGIAVSRQHSRFQGAISRSQLKAVLQVHHKDQPYQAPKHAQQYMGVLEKTNPC
jgi:hypothetical protein